MTELSRGKECQVVAWFPPLLSPRAKLSPGGSSGAERGLSFRVIAAPCQGKPMVPVTPAGFLYLCLAPSYCLRAPQENQISPQGTSVHQRG